MHEGLRGWAHDDTTRSHKGVLNRVTLILRGVVSLYVSHAHSIRVPKICGSQDRVISYNTRMFYIEIVEVKIYLVKDCEASIGN